MRNTTWLGAMLAALALLGLNSPVLAASAAKTEIPSAEWVDVFTFNTADPMCGCGIVFPAFSYLPANLPPEKHKLAQRIAADAERDIEALKKDITAKSLELKALAGGAMNTTREEIRRLSGDIADGYKKLRQKYHDAIRRMHDEAGLVPVARHAMRHPSSNAKAGYLPYTPLYWEFTEVVNDVPAKAAPKSEKTKK